MKNPISRPVMKNSLITKGISRREFLKGLTGAFFSSFISHRDLIHDSGTSDLNPLFWIKDIPMNPFYLEKRENRHAGIDALLYLMGLNGLKFYRSHYETVISGLQGMIRANDVVLIKVNAQWKYRGCTNSDLICGLIQCILDHPDVFTGEVVIFENGQGRGSLNCDTKGTPGNPYPDSEVHANANDESHSYLYLVNTVFRDPRVSAYLLDPIRGTLIANNDHDSDGYRSYENVSYPCFTTEGGHRIELREGIWDGEKYKHNLKLINVPVLKHHDTGGSEITAALKHFYGIVSMGDGHIGYRHYEGLGETCGKMVVSVCTPVLNIIDAIWISHSSRGGYPESKCFRANQILASQDPVALDYWAAKHVLYPIDHYSRHHPDFPGIDKWLSDASEVINGRGGLYNSDNAIVIKQVTKNEEQMHTYSCSAKDIIDTLNIIDIFRDRDIYPKKGKEPRDIRR